MFHPFRPLLLGPILFAFATAAGAVAPALVAYQGLLTNVRGDPLSGPVQIEIGIYDAPDSGALLYREIHARVPLRDGVFQILIGAGESAERFSAELFEKPDRWLEVVVENERLTPRQRFGSVAYALRSGLEGEVGALAARLEVLQGKVATLMCGNGALDPGEQCDDGNNSDGDGCSAGCRDEDACSACEERFCRNFFGSDTVASCFEDTSPAGGGPEAGCNPAIESCTPNNVLCGLYVECAIDSGTAAVSDAAPYCGQASINECLLLGGTGPCVPEAEAAGETGDPLTVAERFVDPAYPLGDGTRYLRCLRANCARDCL